MNLHAVYQDKESGLWKWGKRGIPMYETKEQASRAGIDMLTDRLRKVRDQVNNALMNHGH